MLYLDVTYDACFVWNSKAVDCKLKFCNIQKTCLYLDTKKLEDKNRFLLILTNQAVYKWTWFDINTKCPTQKHGEVGDRNGVQFFSLSVDFFRYIQAKNAFRHVKGPALSINLIFHSFCLVT